MPKNITPARRNQSMNGNHSMTEVLRITNISSYANNLKTLAKPNSDWHLSPEQIVAAGKANRNIYRIKFINTPVRFVPTEDGSGTTTVLINGNAIGILDQNNTTKLKALISSAEIHSVTCSIYGGMYKTVDETYNVEIQQKGISAAIKVTYQSKAVNSVSATDVQKHIAQTKKTTKTASKKKQQKAIATKTKKNTKKKPVYKRLWFWLIGIILVLGSCNNGSATPATPETTVPTTSIIAQSETIEETTLPPTTEISTTAMPTTEPEITTIPTTEPTTLPETEAITVAAEPETTATPYVEHIEEETEEMVWISNTGSKYHSKPDCSRMKNPSLISREAAEQQNREACKNCY